MKKFFKVLLTIVILILIIVIIVFYFKTNYSQVTVYINDIDKVKIYNVHNGKQLQKLDSPNMDGYAFAGWYYLDTEERFDFSTKITKDITIFAKWAKITVQ